MINNVEEYLAQLRRELAGCDRATVQDALSDAEEHLRNAIAGKREESPGIPDNETTAKIIEEYGTPAEVAAAYKRIEKHAAPAMVIPVQARSSSVWYQIFGILADPRAWGALFYLLFSLATGIAYFTWAITGISLSAGLIVLIVGLPFFGLFILSVRGIALIEGRLIEALIGIRMPHRPFFSPSEKGLWGKFKGLVTDKYTWFALVYMILQMPLGIIYFTIFIMLITVSFSFIVQPVLQSVFGIPFITAGFYHFFTPIWLMPVFILLGITIFILTMQLAKRIATFHGKFAKAMLVRE